MSNARKLSLTDALRAFVDQNSGDGTLFTTPGEFVRSVLREKKMERLEAARVRAAILEGYQDAIEKRTVSSHGNLRPLFQQSASGTTRCAPSP